MKGPTEKNFEGIYSNPRLMHAVGLVVGCIAHVQVKSGSIFEGVLKTVSHKAQLVLEMAHKIETRKVAGSTVPPPITATNAEEFFEKLIITFDDVVCLTARDVDSEFATREGFTDCAISKFNGQVLERELEPWDGGTSPSDSLPDLGGGGGGDEEANGWDPNDMFRTNEEKYGVKSSFDSTLPGYTIPLTKQNTEEYKQQEAKASKIAQEIESGNHHKYRAALENGDEEERFSAVIRPDSNFRFVTHRTRRSQRMPPNMRGGLQSSHMNRGSHQQHSQMYHRISSPSLGHSPHSGAFSRPQGPSQMMGAPPHRPTPTSTPPTARQMSNHGMQSYQHMPQSNMGGPPMGGMGPRATPPTTPVTVPHEEGFKVNGESEKSELKYTPKPPRTLNLPVAANKEMRESVSNQQLSNKIMEPRKEFEKKTPIQKSREDKTQDLKRFQANFKLTEEVKSPHEKESLIKNEMPPHNSSTSTPLPPRHYGKDKAKDNERKANETPENRRTPEMPKSSNLNPNAKEFVFNPNAKSFTPRAIPAPVSQHASHPPSQQPPRLASQSPVLAAVPQTHMVPAAIPQPVFAPQYIVSAPVSIPTQPFNHAPPTQPPRYRKSMPVTLQRHDMPQQVHVQAATGQPLLAQPTAGPPQFTIQYTPGPPSMLGHPAPPQQLYTQMYPLMSRVLAPQVGVVPTSAAYGENPQIPAHVYVPHHATQGMTHAMAAGPTGNSSVPGQYSAPSTPQPQTPSMQHPAPSPHPPHPGQPPTPTGGGLMYHPLQPPIAYGGPQSIVLVPPGQHPHFPPHHLHHPGGQITMVPQTPHHHHSQAAAHYVPHSQV